MTAPLPAENTAAAAFDARAQDYDRWFDEHTDLYRAELTSVAELLTPIRAAAGASAEGLEVGVGTGRFAAPLGISHGLEPAPRMACLARARGVDVTAGVAEDLPFDTARFAYTAFLTSLCFVTDPVRALREAHRVTVEGGAILAAYLNRASPPGQNLAARQAEDPYYAHAHLMTTRELETLLREAGFVPEDSRQVLTGPDGAPVVCPGAEDGLFCVLRGRKGTARVSTSMATLKPTAELLKQVDCRGTDKASGRGTSGISGMDQFQIRCTSCGRVRELSGQLSEVTFEVASTTRFRPGVSPLRAGWEELSPWGRPQTAAVE